MRCSQPEQSTRAVNQSSQPEKRLWEGKGVIVDEKLVILGKNMLGTICMTYRPSETMYP